uniref:leucine-rich repeat-containing protein 14 n=1 Tax=Lonchura striata TaxID=40157 RepID=UPI0012934A1B|nr:leucine-rich repeat-containing protein 14 [Lonchura striata domestica]
MAPARGRGGRIPPCVPKRRFPPGYSDSLLFLCARRLVARPPLPPPPAHLYPVLFQAAFLDGRPRVLGDLVSSWPFPALHLRRLLGRQELLRDQPCKLCLQALVLALVATLRRQLEEPGRRPSSCRLRVLDMTGVPDDPSGRIPDGMDAPWSGTVALAKACLELSKHQREFQRRGSKRHKESAVGIRCLAGQLGMLPGLRELNLGSSRLSGNLRQILGELRAPLESLELAFCSLLPADLAFLSRSRHAPALKRLDLSGHDFSRALLEPLRLLLEETSASLLHLELTECRLADAQLAALLPALRRCRRLRFLGLHGNALSTAALRELLLRTLELPDLRLVVYPFPADCYKPEAPRRVPGSRRVYEEPMDGHRLAAAAAEISRTLADSGRADLVWTYNPYGHAALDYFSL